MSNFTVYNSSAGSGKTFTLTKEYLKIVLENPNKFEHVLAITFTKKAANEMKERIISSLVALSVDSTVEINPKTEILLNQIINETQIDRAILLKNAKITLNNILHHYSSFAVSTIDSFINKIIRTFALDLRLPANFDIELDTDTILTEVIDILLSEAGSDPWLTQLLIDFSIHKVNESTSWKIETPLHTISKELWKEEAIIPVKSLNNLGKDDILNAIKNIKHFIREYEKEVKLIALKAKSAQKQARVENKQFFQGDKGIGKYFDKIIAGDCESEPNSYTYQTINDGKWTAAKASQTDIQAVEQIQSIFTDCFNEIENYRNKNLQRYKKLKLVSNNIYPLSLLTEINARISDLKAEKNIIPINEFNAIIAEIVLNEPVPFIYERVGEKYEHYLFDEFQDTSVLQWMNVLPLIENSLASGNFNMLVGDAKQSIYRWRSGEVEQFTSLPEIYKAPTPVIKEKEQILKENFLLKNLSSNYRSKVEIILFNNLFFKTVKSLLSENYQGIYDNVEQEFKPENTGGYVQIDFLEKDGENDYNTLTINNINEIISQQLADNYNYRDISIVCRSNSDSSYIASELTNSGIPVISNESLLVNFSSKVRFIIAILEYINNSNNHLAKTLIAYHIAKDSSYSFYELTVNETLFNEELTRIGFDYKKIKHFAIYDTCEEIIRVFGFDKSPDAYIQYFLDTIFSYSQKNSPSISEFLIWYESNKHKLSLSLPDGENAINIITIHKSKGLEFKVVIYPYANKKFGITKDNFWTELEDEATGEIKYSIIKNNKKQLEGTDLEKIYTIEENKSVLDSINILYVAFTRAVDRLYILSGNDKNRKEKFNTANILDYFLKETALFEEAKLSYSFGIRANQINNKFEESTKQHNLFISRNWTDRTSISFSAERVWDNESIVWGTLIHLLLSEINQESDIELAILKAINEGLFLSSQMDEISNKLKQIINHPLLINYFSNVNIHKNECDIILPQYAIKRPDKLIITKNGVTIIDYKTGNVEEKHQKQVKDYSSLIKQMGYQIHEQLLVYINEEIQVIPVL
ncbi:MAG: UvrD-helicase domain-containing protein [Bacteroidota bacterium]